MIIREIDCKIVSPCHNDGDFNFVIDMICVDCNKSFKSYGANNLFEDCPHCRKELCFDLLKPRKSCCGNSKYCKCGILKLISLST